MGKAAARKALEHVDSYVLHREYKRPRKFNPYYVYKRRELVQADLIDVQRLSIANDGVKHLLVIIDVFSRKLWVYPLKNKAGLTVRRALAKWLASLRRKPKLFMTDKGTEFKNQHVRRLREHYRVRQQWAIGTSKAAYAERVNKTLQILIFKYLTDRETNRYIDVLPDLVTTYNTRKHGSLKKFTPEEADRPGNALAVRAVHMERYRNVKRRKPRFKVGDAVRVKTDSKALVDARRAYAEQFHGEYFTIVRINRRMPIPMYFIKSMDTDELIKGSWYGEELTRVRGNAFKVERTLGKRGRGRARQILVKWKYFGSQHNQWIPARDVTEVYR